MEDLVDEVSSFYDTLNLPEKKKSAWNSKEVADEPKRLHAALLKLYFKDRSKNSNMAQGEVVSSKEEREQERRRRGGRRGTRMVVRWPRRPWRSWWIGGSGGGPGMGGGRADDGRWRMMWI